MFAYKTTTGSAPLYLNSLPQTYVPSRSLRSASERRFTVPSQRGTKSFSQTFKLKSEQLILSHLQESAKNTSLPFYFQALSILKKSKKLTSFSILLVLYLFVFFIFILQLTKAKKHITLAGSILFLFYQFSFYLSYNKKKLAMCNVLS